MQLQENGMVERREKGAVVLSGWLLALVGSINMSLLGWCTYTTHMTAMAVTADEIKDQALRESIGDLKAIMPKIVTREAYDREQSRHTTEHNTIDQRINSVALDLQELKIRIAEMNLRLLDTEKKPARTTPTTRP